jgi:hypothetical protein
LFPAQFERGDELGVSSRMPPSDIAPYPAASIAYNQSPCPPVSPGFLKPPDNISKVTQRDCRKILGSKNVYKNLPQQAEKFPKCCQNVVRNTKNQALFSVSLPLFKNYF